MLYRHIFDGDLKPGACASGPDLGSAGPLDQGVDSGLCSSVASQRRKWWCSCLTGEEVRGGGQRVLVEVVWASLCLEVRRCQCWS